MKKLPSIALSFFFISSAPAFAALMLDFGATAVADPYLTQSPGHDSGWVAGGDTAWNTITSSASRSDSGVCRWRQRGRGHAHPLARKVPRVAIRSIT